MNFESAFLDDDHLCDIPKRPDPLESDMPKYKKLFLRYLVASDKHPEHRKYFECENDILFDKQRQANSSSWFVMHPCSVSCSIWDSFMFFLYIFDLICIPFIGAHLIMAEDLKLITIFIQLLHIVKQFFTAYIDEKTMTTVFEYRDIARHYLNGWFAIDFIGVFPWTRLIIYTTLIAVGELDADTRIHLEVVGMTALLNVHQLFKCSKVMLAYFNATARTIRLIRLLVVTFYFVHWSACLCAFLPYCIHATNLSNVKESWLNYVPEGSKRSPLQHTGFLLYFFCFFRAVSMILGLGIGTFLPKTKEDAYLSVVIMVLGRLYLYYCLEEAIGIGKFLQSASVKYRTLMNRLKAFINRRQLPPTTEAKVKTFYERRLDRTFFRERQLELLMSGSLRDELRNHELRQLVRSSKLLSALPPATVAQVVRCLKLDVFLPSDVVVRAGGSAESIFFLAVGLVAVYGRNGEERIHLSEGDFFGEVEFILPGANRNIGTVVALELSEIYRLEKRDFDRFIRTDPDALRIVQEMAYRRMYHSNLADQINQEFGSGY